MKLFKYFTWAEIKEICLKLEKSGCYYRHPKQDFIEILGQKTVDEMFLLGFIKNSPKLKAYWIDYYHPCYEYGNFFRKIYNFVTTPFWLWFKIYFLQYYTIKYAIKRFTNKIGITKPDTYAKDFYAVES